MLYNGNQKAIRFFSRIAFRFSDDSYPARASQLMVEMAGIEPASATFALKRLQA